MNKKKSKRRDSSSSNDSNSDSDSNSSSSPVTAAKRSSTKRRKSPEGGKKPNKKGSDSEDEKSNKNVEHSKWDSPDSRNKKQKVVEHRSYSRDREQHRDRHNRDDRHKRDNRPNHTHDRRHDQRRQENRHHDRRNDREDNRHRRDNKNPQNDRQHDRRDRRRRSSSFDHTKATWGRNEPKGEPKEKNVNKEKPNFGLSGKLTEETNTFKGFVIKYSEPPEARKPKRRWRLYPFKGEKAMQTLYIHRESAYLIGRERKIVDLPVDHPSCSKQHAALQYRLVPFTRDDGSTGKRVRPYIIDLESANGTFLNNKKIEPKKYIELLEKDVLKFGFSSREYVLLHENSKDDAMDDDVKLEEVEVKNELED